MELVERKTPQTVSSTPGLDPRNYTQPGHDDHAHWDSHEWHSGDHGSDTTGPIPHNHTEFHLDDRRHLDRHPVMEEPRLPDESGWYDPSSVGHRDHHGHHAMTARTGAVLTSAAVGILVLGIVLIVLMIVFYRRRRMQARRQAVLAKAQRNLCVSGLGMDNPNYIVPLNGDDKKLGLDVTTMVSASDYPALLDQCAPPSYQQATADHCSSSPNYSLEPDDNPEQVPVLRRLSITLPEDHGTDPNKTEQEV